MGGEDDPAGNGRLRLLAPPTERFFTEFGACSQLSRVPGTREAVEAELFATREPLRGALEAFPFVIGLGQALLSSQLFNL